MNTSVRVFISAARLSFPALDEPREAMNGQGSPKYQATFLIAPDNPCVPKIKEAIAQAARAYFGQQADKVLSHPDQLPLSKGDDKENVPAGYEGMLYLSARSKNRPELRDANPRIIITDPQQIREKFIAGYRVNGFVDIFGYVVKAPNGSIMKSGISAGLVSVQFKAYAETFSGAARTSDSDYPDETQSAEASSQYAAAPQGGYGQPEPAPTVKEPPMDSNGYGFL